MVSLFDVIEDLMVLWIVLGIALIGLVAWLCYRFIPGLRIEKEEVDEKQAAKEELDRFLVPMDEDVEIKKEGGKIKMWPAVKQMKEKSFNSGADYGALKFADRMVNSNILTIDQAARELNLTVEEYLAAVKNLKK